MNIFTEKIEMSDGQLSARHCWIPEGELKAIVYLSHGMNEYTKRYEEFAQFLGYKQIAFIGHDHRGHGDTAESTVNLGFIAEKHGFIRAMLDLKEHIQQIRNAYPNTKIILLAHSFGSFVGQYFVENHGNLIDGCIYSGTAGPRPGLGTFIKIMTSIFAAIHGKKHPSKLLYKLAFGSYNNKVPHKKTAMDWLTNDEKEVARYLANPFCAFLPSVQFYHDLGEGLSLIHKKNNIRQIPKELEILFLTGLQDPVGSYGKTVDKLIQCYQKENITKVTVKNYPEGRHEMLNELNKKEVYQELYNWIQEHILA